MKPTSLQDAIKANALKKIQKRERGEWKEPVVKQHKMTADEFKAVKQVEKPRSINADMTHSSMTTIAVPDTKFLQHIEALQSEVKAHEEQSKLVNSSISNLKNEMNSIRSELKTTLDNNWKLREELTALQYEFESMKDDMNEQIKYASKNDTTAASVVQPTSTANIESELNLLRTEFKKMRSDMSSMKDEIQSLQKENKNLTDEIKIIKKPAPERYSTPVRERSDKSLLLSDFTAPLPPPPRQQPSSYSSPLNRSSPTKSSSSLNITPRNKENNTAAKETTSLSSLSTSPRRSSIFKSKCNDPTPDTPKKDEKTDNCKTNIPIDISPFTAEKLEFNQRKDEAFQRFIKTKEGLFPLKKMSIQETDKHSIVCFKKRIYIPLKLREKAIEYYKKTYGNNASTKLQENFIWPEMDRDLTVASRHEQRQ